MRVAIIPARGGSKRIPRKNIRDFAGKPMLAHSVRCALESGLFDRVIVSTDDDEIARVATSIGAEVPFVRPDALSDDYAGTVDVVAHAVEWLQKQAAVLSAVCCIYATSPFTRSDDLKHGLALLESGEWHYVFSATSFAFPIFRAFQKDTSRGVQMFFPEHLNSRSQDVPEALHDAGQFYWGRPESWLRREPVFGVRSTVVMIPRWRVQDIDTLEDWDRAQLMWQVLHASDGRN